MGIESATYLNQLDPAQPGSNDPKSEGDNHLRLLKAVLLATFPNIAGAMNISHTRLNLLGAPQLVDTTAGTAPNFTVAAPAVAPTVYVNGQLYFIEFHAAGTTGSNTLNIATLGAKPLKRYDEDGVLVAAAIPAGFISLIAYDLSEDCFVVLTPTPPIHEFAVGDYKLSDRTSFPSGYRWLLCDGKTIGNASSGGTALASAEAQELFEFLWTSHSNTLLEIQTSGGVATTRGASAAADFAANKRMPLPNWSGLGIRIHHNGDSTYEPDTTRVLGSYQADAFQGHHHTTNATSGSTSRDGGSFTTSATVAASVTDPITDGVNGTPRTASETRGKNRSANIFIRY